MERSKDVLEPVGAFNNFIKRGSKTISVTFIPIPLFDKCEGGIGEGKLILNKNPVMKLDQLGTDYLLLKGIHPLEELTNYIYIINDSLRVNINNNTLTQNMFNACMSLCISIGEEAFRNSLLVKIINSTVNLNNVTISSPMLLEQIKKHIKLSISYGFLVTAKTEEDIKKRKEDIKLYFS